MPPNSSAAVALMVGLGFRMLLREATTRAAAIDALLAARADVAEMSRRAGELDERARLAADIHDTVAQGLSSIQLLLHSAEASARDHDDPARDAGDRADAIVDGDDQRRSPDARMLGRRVDDAR